MEQDINEIYLYNDVESKYISPYWLNTNSNIFQNDHLLFLEFIMAITDKF